MRSEFCGFLKKLYRRGRSQTSIYQIMNSEAPLHPLYTRALHARNISTKHDSALNTRNDLICGILDVTSRKRKIASGVAVRGDSGVAGEGRVVGVPKFHSCGKCTMTLTNTNSDWMSNASSGLCIN